MLGRNAIRTLASLAYSVDDPIIAELRLKAEEVCENKLRTGTYITGLGWTNWKHVVDYLSEWVARNPDAPVPREFNINPRYAHDLATRKAVARKLADRWQDKRGIRPERRVDTTEGTD